MIAGLEDITEGTLSIGDRVVNDIDPAKRDALVTTGRTFVAVDTVGVHQPLSAHPTRVERARRDQCPDAGLVHVQALRRLGCSDAQGFHFARPMPADELGAWVKAAG